MGSTPYLHSVDISITSACNLRCKHCYLEDIKNANIILSLNKIKEILTDAKELGAYHITLTGGEPTLHPEFFKILEFASKLGFKITIFTNGTTIDRSIALKLRQFNIKNVQVSLEGLKETHENIRGKDTFEKAISGVRHLIDANIKVIINTQLTEEVFNQIRDYVKFLKSLGVSKILFTIPSLVGEAKKNNIYFPSEKIDELRNMLKINKIKNKFRSIPKEDTKPKRTCTALINQLAINFDGTVYPCHYFRSIHHYSLGNIYIESLKDIYNSWINGDSELIRYHKYGIEKCNRCKFKEVCGACAGRIYSLYKNLKYPDLLYCVLFGQEKLSQNIKLGKLVWGRID